MPAEIDILIQDDRWKDVGLTRLCRHAFAAVFEERGISGAGYSLSVLACDDKKIAQLNEDFRGKKKPTNVLSWPEHDLAALVAGEDPGPPPPTTGFEDSLGDIAVSFDTCAKEAADTGLTLDNHLTHLLIHGALHLLGFDHERDGDAVLMEGLETKILATLGVKDPYC
ncbi:MAG: rRNA maturation RNase YbeY [Pseudomonadota bacterium]